MDEAALAQWMAHVDQQLARIAAGLAVLQGAAACHRPAVRRHPLGRTLLALLLLAGAASGALAYSNWRAVQAVTDSYYPALEAEVLSGAGPGMAPARWPHGEATAPPRPLDSDHGLWPSRDTRGRALPRSGEGWPGALAQDVAPPEARGRPEGANRVEGRRGGAPGFARGAPPAAGLSSPAPSSPSADTATLTSEAVLLPKEGDPPLPQPATVRLEWEDFILLPRAPEGSPARAEAAASSRGARDATPTAAPVPAATANASAPASNHDTRAAPVPAQEDSASPSPFS